LRATVGVGAFKPITERLAVVGNLGPTWAGKDDQTEWFGINAAQNAASGLPVYDANAGFRDIEASVVANYKLTEHWGVSLGGGVNRLLGDAADSPISKEDTGVSMFMGVSYKF
jgi:outer membrane scaffolding protein for murein synthesis (MipA/OmpV family)